MTVTRTPESITQYEICMDYVLIILLQVLWIDEKCNCFTSIGKVQLSMKKGCNSFRYAGNSSGGLSKGEVKVGDYLAYELLKIIVLYDTFTAFFCTF